MAGDTLVEELPPITGALIVTQRSKLGMSRNKFAELVEMRPGAVWRLEVRDTFHPGEREYLASIADRWLTVSVPAAPQSTRRAPKPALPSTTTRPTVTGSDGVLCAEDESTADLIQWADAQKPDVVRQLELVFPLDQVSPTAMSALDGITRISNSEIQTFKNCRRKWWLAYVRGLQVPRDLPHGPRATGVRGHAALAAWYRPDGETRMDPRDALEIIINAERAQLADAPNTDESTLSKFNKDVELERVVIQGYMEWIADTGTDSLYRVVGSEQYLEADLPEVDNTRIIARLDARVVRIHDNARLFIDHKFVASIPGAVQLLPLNEQMQLYILLEQLQPDRDPDQAVSGALYNMLRRCKRSAKAQPPFYDRVEVHYNPTAITSYRQRLVGVLDDMAYCRTELEEAVQSHQLTVYPTPTRDCSWSCQFVKVCAMADDGSRFEDALADHYTVDDPYGYYKSSVKQSEE